MTSIMEKAREIRQRSEAARNKVVTAARPLVALLKDHKLDYSASELAAALFELDAAEEELRDLVKQDPRAFITAFLDGLEKGGAR